MFVLKIIVVWSAILNIALSKTQCGPDQTVEFQCQNPTCENTVKDKLSQGQLLTSPKDTVSVVGTSKKNFLIEKKGKLSIVPSNHLKVQKFPKDEHWKYKVNINKKTYEICKLNNKSTEDNLNGSNTVQTKTSSDNIFETSEIIEEPCIVSDKEEEDNTTIGIEGTDESNLDSSFVNNPSVFGSFVANNLANEAPSAKSDNIPSPDPINQNENDSNEITNQKNIAKPTSKQKLENDSSAECTLDSCVEDIDTYAVKKEFEKSFVTKESSNNINSAVDIDKSIDYSHQHKNDQVSATEQSSTENIDSSLKKPINNVTMTNSDTNNLPENNSTEELSSDGFHQQQNENFSANEQQSSIKNTEISTEESVNNNLPQNSYPNEFQGSKKGSKELNMDSSYEDRNKNLPNYVEITDNLKKKPMTYELPSKLNSYLQNKNIDVEKLNEAQQQERVNSGSLTEMADLTDNHSSPLEKDKVELNNKNESLHNNSVENSSLNYYNTSTKNEPQIPLDLNNNTEADLSEVLNNQRKPESQNMYNENLLNVESTTPNNNSVDNTLYPSALKKLADETDIVSSPNNQNTDVSEENITEGSIESSCMSESGSCHSKDNYPEYSHERIQQTYSPENKDLPDDSVHKFTEHDDDIKSKEFDPKSFVASFGHPDACSGIGCLNFNRNVEKTIKSSRALNSVSEQVVPDVNSLNTDLGKENKNINIIHESTDMSDVELSVLDSFQSWICSPTLSTIRFLKYVFGEYFNDYDDVYSDKSVDNKKMFGNDKHINHLNLYFIVVAVVTVLFSLIYYKYQKGTYENYLLTLLAAKDENLLIIEKELSLLKEKGFENTSVTTVRNSDFETLKEQSEDITSSQALRIEKLEQEVEELTESGMEMHSLLSSTLNSNAKNKEKLNSLKCKLTETEHFVSLLTQKNFEKTSELEKRNELFKNLQMVTDELKHTNMNLVEDNANISLQLEQEIAKNTVKESKLVSEINSLKYELDKLTNAFVTAENEVLLSKNSLQEVLSQKFSPADAKKFLSSVKLSAELKSAKQMCEEYKHKLNESLKSNQQNLDHIDVLKNDVLKLEDKYSKLQRQYDESTNKLSILTTFFKEQEKEYVKQINEKSMLYDTKKGESSDLNERIKSLNEEIRIYKSEIQSLKKEITNQENSFKIQISAADKKASDYWISYRQAERKLKEMELETAQLRNKLTMGDKKMENGTKSIDSSKDFEDELLDIPLPTTSPDFTLLDFEPPPPLLTNERLPPLGALGQASSPPVPLSRRHNRSLSPDSPTSLHRSSVFRPLPQRYNYMNRQNSLGHSVESLDK